MGWTRLLSLVFITLTPRQILKAGYFSRMTTSTSFQIFGLTRILRCLRFDFFLIFFRGISEPDLPSHTNPSWRNVVGDSFGSCWCFSLVGPLLFSAPTGMSAFFHLKCVSNRSKKSTKFYTKGWNFHGKWRNEWKKGELAGTRKWKQSWSDDDACGKKRGEIIGGPFWTFQRNT